MKTPHCIIAVVILLLNIIGCSNQNNNPISAPKDEEAMLVKTVEQHEANLRILAQQLAVSLNDKDVTDLLKYKFETASSCESILNFSDLLSENVNGVAFSKKITSDSFKTKNQLERILTEGEIIELINSFDYGLDFYFPVMEHRESWKSNINKMFVAYPPLSMDDNKCYKIFAFTLNGNEKSLSAQAPPKEPVLILSPCEHHGDHSIETNTLSKQTLSTTSGFWSLTIYHFKLMDDHEPWYLGNAEIYVKLLDGGHWYSTYCYSIDEETTYWNYNKPINPAWASQPYGQRYFEVWEEDDTSGDDLVEKYWHWPDESDPETRNVDLWLTYWYYGDNNDADLYMGMDYYPE